MHIIRACARLHVCLYQSPLVAGADNSAPMLVTGFIVKAISQQTPSPSHNNTFTVELSCQTLLPRGDVIIVSGLMGAATTSTTLLALVASTSAFGPAGNQTAQWQQDTGELRLQLQHDVAAHEQISFEFSLLNPYKGQDAPLVSVACLGRVRIWPSEMNTGEGNSAALLIADFDVASISQSTPGALLSNLLSIDVGVGRAALPVGSILYVTGLTGSDTADRVSITILGNVSNFSTPDAVWKQSTGTLSVTIAVQVPAETLVVLEFVMLNGRVPQDSPEIFIGCSGAVTIAPLRMHKAAGNAAPMLIAGINARMQQSSYVRSTPNNLTVTISTNARLANNSIFVISNLRGATPIETTSSGNASQTSALFSRDTSSKSMSDAMTSDRQGALDAWRVDDRIEVQVVWTAGYEVHIKIPIEVFPLEVYRLVFEVYNPVAAQVSPSITLEILGDVPVASVAVRTLPSILAPLAIVSTMDIASISQSTPNTGQSNTISVLFASHDTLYAQDKINITISGLRGAAAPESGWLGINGLSLAHTGVWNKEFGQLVVMVRADIDAGNITRFSFNITNPSEGQEPANISIQSSGLIHLEQVISIMWLDYSSCMLALLTHKNMHNICVATKNSVDKSN